MKNLFISLLALVFVSSASATFTLVAVSGASGSDIEKKTIYGGMAGTCASTDPDALATCDSCTSTTLEACNKTGIYPTLKLRFTFKTDKANLASTATYVAFKAVSTSGTSGAGSLSKSATVTTNSEFTVTVTWGEICNILGEGSTCTDTSYTKLTGTIEAGMDASNSGTPETDQKTSLEFRINRISGTTAYDKLSSTCPVGGSVNVGNSGSSNVGICDFTMYPGDEKVYVTEIRKGAASSDGVLTPEFDSFPYTSLVVFYAQANGNDASSKSAALAAIKNSSESKEFSLKTVDGEVEINDNRAGGFENGATYCFVSANKNAAGNIFYFTSTGLSTTNNCVTPSEVVGLLDDKHCFIATATFGSPFADEVNTLRNFRNQYLLPFDLGRKFVKFYYQFSPPVAEVIAQSTALRTFSWLALAPLILWVKLVFWLGFAPALLVLLLSMIAVQRLLKLSLHSRRFKKHRGPA